MPLNLNLPFFKQKNATTTTEPTQEEKDLEKIKEFSRGLVTIQDIIAPEAIEVDFTYQKINSTYSRTLFVAGYPRTVPANWLSPLINFPHQLDVSMFIFPVDSKEILDNLKRKITEMEAEIQSDIRSGKISNINTEVKLDDARVIREQLAKGAERFYQYGLYVTIKADSIETLDVMTKKIQSTLGSLLIISKKATLQMDEGFKTTLPMGIDKLMITRNMDTTSLATTFPFTSSELTMDSGIVYGLNEHNDSLVIFDRFRMENANMVVFAKSGAGKSYTVKLEILRQMMFGAEVIILDPEHEYEELSQTLDGEYINFTFGGSTKINPFDLSNLYEEGENELGQKIITLHGLLKVMLGEMTAPQEAMLDRALVASYKAKGITPDPATQTNQPPLMEDLYKSLIGMETPEADDLASRLEKYITGSFRGIFDQSSNLNIHNQLTIFSVKEMSEELRPVAMFVILDFIWTRVKKDLKKRILVIDEAWYFMKHKDSASFIHGMVKRARKYYLGITTITQDVEDFINNDFGRAIVTNASIQFLMKQSTAAIPILSETFYLSEGERQLLMAADVGEGIFFAGSNHVALRVVASDDEHQIITTDPAELVRQRAQKKKQEQLIQEEKVNVHKLFEESEAKEIAPEVTSEIKAQEQQVPKTNGEENKKEADLPRPTFMRKQQPEMTEEEKKNLAEDERIKKTNAQGRNSKDFVRYSIDDYEPPSP
ncbi:MAG: ATP-binding protein [Candidatus Pacebacteria bacterium]|nr:ATP-binding protein [Candidatus Paceibacterota bacterium]